MRVRREVMHDLPGCESGPVLVTSTLTLAEQRAFKSEMLAWGAFAVLAAASFLWAGSRFIGFSWSVLVLGAVFIAYVWLVLPGLRRRAARGALELERRLALRRQEQMFAFAPVLAQTDPHPPIIA